MTETSHEARMKELLAYAQLLDPEATYAVRTTPGEGGAVHYQIVREVVKADWEFEVGVGVGTPEAWVQNYMERIVGDLVSARELEVEACERKMREARRALLEATRMNRGLLDARKVCARILTRLGRR